MGTGETTLRWLTIAMAAMQIALALTVRYASNQNPLSGLACLGGAFGSLGNIGVLIALGLWALYLAYKSYRAKALQPALRYLPMVVLSSCLALHICAQAMLRCTV